jgi:hypothetical protein
VTSSYEYIDMTCPIVDDLFEDMLGIIMAEVIVGGYEGDAPELRKVLESRLDVYKKSLKDEVTLPFRYALERAIDDGEDVESELQRKIDDLEFEIDELNNRIYDLENKL